MSASVKPATRADLEGLPENVRAEIIDGVSPPMRHHDHVRKRRKYARHGGVNDVGRGGGLHAVPLVAAMAAGAVAIGCGPECSAERCAVAPLLLTIEDASTGAIIADAVISTVPPGATVMAGCALSGEMFGCTHEVWTVPGNDELRVASDEVRPGHGEFEPEVTLRFVVVVERMGFTSRTVPIELTTTECGNVDPRHWRIALEPAGGAGSAPEPVEAAAPPVCGD
jgi:hypothetical protein